LRASESSTRDCIEAAWCILVRVDERPIIEVLYTCEECGLTDVPVPVVARTTEDVVVWLEQVAVPALARDHARRSPRCHVDKFADVKVPMPAGTSKIGGTVEN
jgi:hypothetical protein